MRWATLLLAAAFLLAGCTAPDGDGPEDPDDGPDDPGGGSDGPGGGNGFAPQQHHAEDEAGGLRAEGDLYECGAGFCVDARAWNDGDETMHVSNVCVPPWREEMERDGERVQHREPIAYCAQFGTGPFPPGDESAVNATWDGRVWNGEELEPAPQGAYVWRLTFRAHGDPDGGDPVELTLEFPVVVGAT